MPKNKLFGTKKADDTQIKANTPDMQPEETAKAGLEAAQAEEAKKGVAPKASAKGKTEKKPKEKRQAKPAAELPQEPARQADDGPEIHETPAVEMQENPKNQIKAATLLWNEIKGKALKDNAVVIRVLAICTVLGATTALKNGLLLAAAALVVTIPLYLIMALLKKVPMLVYFSAALLIAGALETPVIMLAGRFFPEVSASCGYFLPITAVNAVLMLDLHVLRGKRSLIRALGAGVGDVLGYSAVLILLSAVREVIGSGSIYGRELPAYIQLNFDFILLPPGAFLMLGLTLAVVQGVKIHAGKSHDGGQNK